MLFLLNFGEMFRDGLFLSYHCMSKFFRSKGCCCLIDVEVQQHKVISIKQKKDAHSSGNPFFVQRCKNNSLEFMTFHTLIAFLNMFFMQFLTLAPGFRAVAVVTQIACRFYKTRGFFCMTACARQFHLAAIACRMLVVHSLP